MVNKDTELSQHSRLKIAVGAGMAGMALILLVLFYTSTPHSNASTYKTATALHTLPTPNFIVTTTYGNLGASKDVCTIIQQEPLWKPGYDAFNMDDSIQKSVRVFINDRQLDKSEIGIAQWNAIRYVVRDGKYAGSTGDWREFCLSTKNLWPDMYIATIKFTLPGGEEYSYSWPFKIEWPSVRLPE